MAALHAELGGKVSLSALAPYLNQWVLSLPFALRYLLAPRPEVVTQVLGIVWRAISRGRLEAPAGHVGTAAASMALTPYERAASLREPAASRRRSPEGRA